MPLKIFVLNNKNLGMVREFQDLYFNKNYQSTVIGYSCPDLKKIAYAYDIEYRLIDDLCENDKKISEILDIKKPVIIEVVIDMFAKLEPKVVYGNSIENQSPFLSEDKKKELERIKNIFRNSRRK